MLTVPVDDWLAAYPRCCAVVELREKYCRGCTRMYADGPELNVLSKLIIGRSFVVANALGTGFLEKVYENALALELREHGLAVKQQRAIDVRYRGAVVGHYVADLFVEDAILIEVKATKSIDPAHLAQCRHYLKATGLRLCLLVNFGGPRVEVKRIVLGL